MAIKFGSTLRNPSEERASLVGASFGFRVRQGAEDSEQATAQVPLEPRSYRIITFIGTVRRALFSNNSRRDLLVVTQVIEFSQFCTSCGEQTFHRDHLERAAGPEGRLKLRTKCQKCGRITSEIDFR